MRSKSFSKIPIQKYSGIFDSCSNGLKRSKSFERLNSNFKENKLKKTFDAKEEDTEASQSASKLKIYYENLCQAKDKQLETIRQAHQRRLERLISLEKQYKLLKDHLRSYVDEEGLKEDYYKHQCKSALNDSELFAKTCSDSIGYVRNDSELLRNELRMCRHDNRRLMHENHTLKESFDLITVKHEDQNEQIETLRLELNLKQSERNHRQQLAEHAHEIAIKCSNERLKKSAEEIHTLTRNVHELDAKCEQLGKERLKHIELSTKLAEENKKLYKKWFQIRTNESKFRSLLIEQMNKHSQSQVKLKRKTCRRAAATKKADEDELLLELMSSSFSSAKSISSMSSSCLGAGKKTNRPTSVPSLTAVKAKIKKFKQNKKEKTVALLRKQFDALNAQKVSLEAKLTQAAAENEKLTKDMTNVENKWKQLKTQLESSHSELNNLKKRELEFKERESNWRKQEDQSKEDMRKQFDARIKQVSADLTRQIGSGKQLKSENEKLTDRLKVNEEKLSHTERDNSQKKQLIEFYKKKLDELHAKEKSDLLSEEAAVEPLNELKLQIKKLNETIEKSRVEVKSLKNRLQVIQTEKSSAEGKLAQQAALFNELGSKFDSLKKEKLKVDGLLKQSRQKSTELEAYVEQLGSTAESKIQHLSDASQHTLSLAQYKLKYAFRSIDGYEKMFKYLYESLIGRCIELRKEIKLEKREQHQQTSALDANMKNAVNLASNVLNLTSHEIEDILSSSSMVANNDEVNKSQNNQRKSKEENDSAYKKHCKKMLAEFEQRLTLSRKETQIKSLDDVNQDIEASVGDEINKELCELISQRLNDVLIYERELASLNAIKQNWNF